MPESHQEIKRRGGGFIQFTRPSFFHGDCRGLRIKPPTFVTINIQVFLFPVLDSFMQLVHEMRKYLSDSDKREKRVHK